MTDHMNISGAAALSTIGHNNGMGAVSGFIDGSSYGETTGDPTDLGDGSFEAPGFHLFLDKDGSTIRTNNRTVIRMGEGVMTFVAHHSVVEASGRFEGYRGDFKASGSMRMNAPGGGEAQFEGRLSRG